MTTIPALVFATSALAVGVLTRRQSQQRAVSEPDNQVLDENIKSMGLYLNVERIFTQLRYLGVRDDDKLDLGMLCKLDQYHYNGTEACDEALEAMKLGPKSTILDIGSGIGGPARYVASKAKCKVLALELQPDLDETAKKLTSRAGLSGLVDHVAGNILDDKISAMTKGRFTNVMSWLAFLHISDKKALLDNCFQALKPGGEMYVEDFVWLGLPISPRDKLYLAQDVFCDSLPSIDQYRTQLENAGFVDVKIENVTDTWTKFVNGRYQSFVETFHTQVAMEGQATAEELRHFYMVIGRLFRGQSVGGVSITCRKPKVMETSTPVSTRAAVKNNVTQVRTFTDSGLRKRAGCICVKKINGKPHVLLVASSKYLGRFGIPAGGVDPGETGEEAAVREVFEEAGVRGSVTHDLGSFENEAKRSTTAMFILDIEEELNEYPESSRKRKFFLLEKAQVQFIGRQMEHSIIHKVQEILLK